MPRVHSSSFTTCLASATKQHQFSLSPNFLSPNFRAASRKSKTLLLPLRASPENLPPPSFAHAAAADVEQPLQPAPLISASDVVRNFYGGISRHDLPAVEDLIALNCVYEDLIFPRPFVGRKAILEFFGKFVDLFSTDLTFVIDAISEEDSSAVGVTWHLEWNERPFPFSKGCSFYRLEIVNGIRQIVYARDSVEPAIKPGESALLIIRGVTWLLQRFPKLVDLL